MEYKSKVFIKLKEKESGFESHEITIEELIFNQNDIEFKFDKYTDGGEVYEDGTLPYNDFLFFRDDYDVIVRVGIDD